MNQEKVAEPQTEYQLPSQPDRKLETLVTLLVNRIISLIVEIRNPKTAQEKPMTENEESRPEEPRPEEPRLEEPRPETAASCQPESAPRLSPLPRVPATPEEARQEFLAIRQALSGPEPEWCLPAINPKAKASDPQLDDSAIVRSCPGIIE